MDYDNPLYAGTFGINGSRYGNFIAYKSDLIIVLGSRLDTHVAGPNIEEFAVNAKKIVIDIDKNEIIKFKELGLTNSIYYNCDLKYFINRLCAEDGFFSENHNEWKLLINHWKHKYPVCSSEYYLQKDINPYVFFEKLSDVLNDNEHIFCDTGSSFAWFNQAFKFKHTQRGFSSFNDTPMGYSFPAAIGAAFAKDSRIICITGDGGFQMNLQELATWDKHRLNIKLILFDNHGYGMVQRTQDMHFNSRYEATDVKSGLAFPDFSELMKVYHIDFKTISVASDIDSGLQFLLSNNEPCCLIVKVALSAPILPQLIPGHSFIDLEPCLQEQEIMHEMNK